MSNFYLGSYANDALNGPNRGWIVGCFMEDVLRKTSDLEIKYWEFKKGKSSKHPKKVSSIIECSLILKGSTKAIVGDEELILSKGDYIVIRPGTPNNLIDTVIEDVSVLTIKAPSNPNAKKVIEENISHP